MMKRWMRYLVTWAPFNSLDCTQRPCYPDSTDIIEVRLSVTWYAVGSNSRRAGALQQAPARL